MDKKTLKSANSLQEAIESIDNVNVAFENNHWVHFNTPDTRDYIPICEPLWDDLKVFLKEKKKDYEEQFDKLN